ncbi:SGNH/GDSL hydrolase family protein [Humibacillus xanthopallidus]|uniref:Lysophospholipase L1-like esterase n=1 Tax=Humibacillus xanthopallidus TaxID=412689 RepID=A0A543HVM1_9MICO|nr:SGNH/GDSL hydrolase family protein [Humibacillus xanthopallidus]TQM62355.1 lysophospholipase L1-like esterase [Humibacillus xanthopallidus]
MDFTADEYARRDADRLREVLAGPPVTWVFLGDSITQGVHHTRGRRGYVEHFAERVRGELGRRSDAVINSGVSATTTEDLLPEFHWRAGRFAPDVVFVMFGTNDQTAGPDGIRGFRYRLDQIVQRSRDVGAMVVLQTPPPVEADGDRTPELAESYAQAVRQVGDDLGVLVIDHAAAWRAAAERDGAATAPVGWLDDTFHPSARGHHELALTLFDGLGIADASSEVCSLVIDDTVGAHA